MSVSDKSMAIADNFVKYIREGNKSLIEQYSIEELRRTKYEYARDSNREFYKAIEDRIAELEEAKKKKESKKDKWFDRGVGFVIGVISAILVAWLLKFLKIK